MNARIGFRSPKYGHRGVYFLCTGPDPSGSRPGPRLEAVIYAGDRVVRRFEQVQGDCLDEGYTDFFNSPRCRPSVHRLFLVDVAPDGTRHMLVSDFQPGSPRTLLETAFRSWVETYGVVEGSNTHV